MKTLLSSAIALVALVTLATPRAGATVMTPLDLAALSKRADRVVLGVVESQRATWTSDHGAIYTEVRLRVSRAYKGEAKPGEIVTIRREGGTVDGIGMKVYGAAVFSDGEEAVVFVERRGTASYVVGMAQGRLPVALDASGRKLVAQAAGEVAFTREAKLLGPRPLGEFERELTRILAVQKVERAR